ncbi:hypothetical protein FOA52_007932 [Chlamydomonas sp. UWO 241]|nr:hypothetical protein FOA52_007932 [Chlamydomonas sp. UWO 241]
MTRFIGDAIGHRTGTRGGSDTGKSRKKKLEDFLATGKHVDIETAERVNQERLHDLPEHDPNRSFVFLDVAIGGNAPGRLVVELFDDVIPVGATHLRNRCMPGSRTGLTGVAVSKLVPHYALFVGKNPAASEGMTLKPVNVLRAMAPGCVAVSFSGDEVAISLARALALDTSGYQVVGRVHSGLEVLDALNDVECGPDSTPFPSSRVTIVRCGPTNARGAHEGLEGSTGPVTTANAVARLKQESAGARSAVLEALQVGLAGAGGSGGGTKRKAEEGGGGGGDGAAAGTSGACDDAAGAPAGKRVAGGGGDGGGPRAPPKGSGGAAKSRMLDAVLGDLSNDDSDASEGG